MPSPSPPGSPKAKHGAVTREENIYIPTFISKRPFYAGTDDETTDYLEHQRLHKKTEDSKWYERGKKLGPAATKYRTGACENCGAMSHKAKDCLERPRAKGAKWTGRDIQADELIQEVKMGWDAKRDRWNGYDVREYRQVVEDYNEMAKLRREIQARHAEETGQELEDGDHYAETSDMSRHQPTSTRQLRLREDTAKYLLNLDLESAKYDPKTRTIVDVGASSKDKAAEAFVESKRLKKSGDAAEFEKAQRYAWEAQEKGGDTSLHLQANPTAGEFSRKKIQEAEDIKKKEKERMLLEKYGGSGGVGDSGDTSTSMPTEELKRLAQVTVSERYVEYDELGLVKGAPRVIARSKYTEDVFLNNHTSVWGSWWSNFRWGYACCHSFVKNSYCTGEEGKIAWEAAEKQRSGVALIEAAPAPEAETETEAHPADDAETEANDVQKGPDDHKKKKLDASDQSLKPRAKKRTAADMMDAVSEAEMEEYRKKRTAADDPMAKMLGRDELVH